MPDVKTLNAFIQKLPQQKSDDPGGQAGTRRSSRINAILTRRQQGVFYKDIGKEFLDQNGGLSGEIMPDYLHPYAKGWATFGVSIKGDIEKLVKQMGQPGGKPNWCSGTRQSSVRVAHGILREFRYTKLSADLSPMFCPRIPFPCPLGARAAGIAPGHCRCRGLRCGRRDTG